MCVRIDIYKNHMINKFLLLLAWKVIYIYISLERDIYIHMIAEFYRGYIYCPNIQLPKHNCFSMSRITTLPLYLDNWLNDITQLHILKDEGVILNNLR